MRAESKIINKISSLPALCVLFGAAYFLISLLSSVFSPLNTWIEFRYCDFLPMASGLIAGPWGALSCAAANLLSDLVKEPFDAVLLYGAAGVFLMGYLPYKLWHLILPSKNGEAFFFDSSFSVLKYTAIAFISSVCAAAFTAAGGDLMNKFRYSYFFSEVGLQYFDFSLIVGMLFFHLITHIFRICPYIPKNAYLRRGSKRKYIFDYVLCAAICALCFALYFIQNVYKARTVNTLCAAVIVLIILLALLPFSRSKTKVNSGELSCRFAPRLQGQFITGFLVLLVVLMSFNIWTDSIHMIQHNEAGAALWFDILYNTAIIATLMIIVLSLLLKWIEKHVTAPVIKTSEYAKSFAKDNSLTEEELSFPDTHSEIDDLRDSIRIMSSDIKIYAENAKARAAQEERLSTEMRASWEIQKSLLPDPESDTGEFSVGAVIQPAREIGGDLYDFNLYSPKKLFVAAADVSGKGISAALFMIRLKTLLMQERAESLSKAASRLNRSLSENNAAMMFATVLLGVIDMENLTFTYVNAGHNPPVLYSNGKARFLPAAHNIAMGISEDAEYAELKEPLSPDFKLLLYTDGVTECENESGEFYGEQRLLDAASEIFKRGLSAQQSVSELYGNLKKFAGEEPQSDDITVLCAEGKKGNQVFQITD